ncbi:MAG: hypothetical protein DMG15_17795 [Acidobacteria bacterium]|nr:MAG: hypothetical protein DMG16_17030 [Acidobacteriota bacterium]PYS11442.1 MAG: hypothetical protein DMG15_17795 [Acidobacteriota bacterium]
MQRYKVDENVVILAQFAHLYPSHTGVVIRFKPDPFRTTFNEYTIRFPDGSTADLFEFQLIDNISNDVK